MINDICEHNNLYNFAYFASKSKSYLFSFAGSGAGAAAALVFTISF